MNKVKILIRFDDICPTMSFEQFGRAVDLMETYGVKPLIGVIPDCKDPDLKIEPQREDFWEYVKSLSNKGFTIAMHGYQHIFDSKCHGIVDKRMESEFAGHSYEVQYEKIRNGKEILKAHGISTDVFFAPAHSYDNNTIKALSQLGFKYVSDGKSNKPFIREGIMMLPCRSGGCPKIKKRGMYTTVFHAHEWNRPEKAYGFDDLKHLLENHLNEIVSFDTYRSVTPSQAWLQIPIEKLFVFYSYNIRPVLSEVYHMFKK